ncbi:HlyC/CorC family transporter [Candidatus Sumerlaeota bacterium]|nr:HlyC/CorC family transporter [Candidatus Sumerlaeota bacterium]
MRFFMLFCLVLLAGFLAPRVWSQSPSDGNTAVNAGDTINGTSFILVTAVGLLLLSGLVSGSETAIFSLNKLDVIHARRSTARYDRALISLLDRPNDTLTTILVLNNLINVALALSAGALMERMEQYVAVPAWLGFVLAGFFAASFILVFGEILPKSLAHARAPQIARAMAWPTAAAALVLTPIRILMNRFIGWVFAALKVPKAEMTDVVSEEELKAMISTGDVATLLEADEREMIQGVFELGDTFVEEIMVPRTEVVACSVKQGQREMMTMLRGTGHTRLLIYGENLDHLVGFVLSKEVLLSPDRDWKEFIRDVLIVPERVRLFDLLARFRRGSAKIAVVVDEYGGMAGIVTLHDVLEEIVGDRAERHEHVEDDCRLLGPGHWRVRGKMRLPDLGRELEVEFPDNMGTTVGGFFMNKSGKVPSEGAELRHNGLSLKVTRMVGRRITFLEVRAAPDQELDAGAGQARSGGDP